MFQKQIECCVFLLAFLLPCLGVSSSLALASTVPQPLSLDAGDVWCGASPTWVHIHRRGRWLGSVLPSCAYGHVKGSGLCGCCVWMEQVWVVPMYAWVWASELCGCAEVAWERVSRQDVCPDVRVLVLPFFLCSFLTEAALSSSSACVLVSCIHSICAPAHPLLFSSPPTTRCTLDSHAPRRSCSPAGRA